MSDRRGSDEERTPHWSTDRYWLDALEEYGELRSSGCSSLTLDLDAIEEMIADGNGPAHKLLQGMVSVNEHEGMDGFRGAPRLVLGLLAKLAKTSRDR
jgi:hypothetical protein